MAQATTTAEDETKTYRVKIAAWGGYRFPIENAADPVEACELVEREKVVSEIDRGDLSVRADSARRDAPDWVVSLVGTTTITLEPPAPTYRSRSDTPRHAAESRALEQVDVGDLPDADVVASERVSCRLFARMGSYGVSIRWFDGDVDDDQADEYVAENVRQALDGRRVGNSRPVGRLFLDADGRVVDHELADEYALDS